MDQFAESGNEFLLVGLFAGHNEIITIKIGPLIFLFQLIPDVVDFYNCQF